MNEPCKHDDRIISMHEDIRQLLTEFQNMNGQLLSTKKRFDKHDDESVLFRKKVNELWAIVHTVKCGIGLLFASGLIFRIFIWITRG